MPTTERRTALPIATKRVVYEDAYIPRSKPAKYKCEMCGESFLKKETQIDHIKAWADGGTHERGNLRILCSDGARSCHRRVTRKQSKARQRGPKSSVHLAGRIIVSLLVVAVACGLAYAAASLAGDTATTDALRRVYGWTGGILVGISILFLSARVAWRKNRPAKKVETVSSDTQRIEAWLTKAIPDAKVKVAAVEGKAPTITVDYPSHVGTHDGTWRNDILEKAEDLYPAARIHIDWQTERDRFIIRDIPDPLRVDVDALPMAEIERIADYSTVDFGKSEDGKRFRLPVLGTHILVGGQTGSGKSSGAYWTIIRGLAPGIRDGLVKVHAIDPKGGVELGPGLDLWASFSDGEEVKNALIEPLDPKADEPSQMDAHLAVLNGAVEQLRTRLRKMKSEGLRKISKPSVKYPMNLVVIDEAAFVLAYAADPKSKKAAQNALEVLTSQGRAAGFVVICLVQDPSAEVVKIRNLLPTRLALRVDTPTEVRMLLGDGARSAGARADKISRNMPGTGFMLTETDNRPIRFRTPFVSDAEIQMLARDYVCNPGISFDK